MSGAIQRSRATALFSANFDAQHGLTSGVETGIRLAAGPVLDTARRYFEHAMEQSDLTLALDPTVRDLGARWRADWPLAHTIAISATDAVWQQFTTVGAEAGAALFTPDGDGRIHLHVGRSSWTLAKTATRYILEPDPKGPPESADTRLTSWLESAGRKNERSTTSLGLCPAVFERSQSRSN